TGPHARHPIPEIHAADARTTEDGDVAGVNCSLHPAGLAYFADAVDPRRQVREAEVAVDVGNRAQMRGTPDGVQNDGPARQARLARIVHPVTIAVLELLARDPT